MPELKTSLVSVCSMIFMRPPTSDRYSAVSYRLHDRNQSVFELRHFPTGAILITLVLSIVEAAIRVAIIGQQAFGKATLEAFLARGDTVAGVFSAPEKGRPDPLRLAAETAGVPVHMFPRLTTQDAQDVLRAAAVDVAIMAFVTQFVSQPFCAIPRFGTIQFHPSLLPAHRGASSLGWAIILGRTETGFSIFRPTDGLDEGPLILQRAVPIHPDDTVRSLYFDRIFPMGIAGLLEAADQVVAGTASEHAQPETGAGYEGIIGEAEARINWASHIDITYNLIRGCNPAPGAWTTQEGRKLILFDCEKLTAGTFTKVKGQRIGEIVAADGKTITIHGQGGFIVVQRLKLEGGQKIPAGDAGLHVGTLLA